eukprot:gnl/Dysnectes_brevis/2687_a3256_1361.p1 GENE.gnl/Dysnectes_brevis/2687_a3256_1361~~gnl/Dysnectes_brevis/2687_a3256_1361.p1  ORF type:complete len:310 (-),score=90.25 gnl/Dysnectes_brevis/2687_a3256_1361:96-1025(-)
MTETQPERVIRDCHTHTYLCKHAQMVLPRALIAMADAKGFKGTCICCHNPFPADDFDFKHRMSFKQWDTFLELIKNDQALAKVQFPEMDIAFHLELDWWPAHPEMSHKVAAMARNANVDAILGSVHYNDCREEVAALGPAKAIRKYLKDWTAAVQSGLFDIMSHFDFFKAMIGVQEANRQLARPELRQLVLDALDVAAAAGVAFEVNTSAFRYGADFFPTRWIVEEAAARGIPFCMSSDCHRVKEVGRLFDQSLEMFTDIGVSELCYWKGGVRSTYGVGAAVASLREVDMVGEEIRILADPVLGKRPEM